LTPRVGLLRRAWRRLRGRPSASQATNRFQANEIDSIRRVYYEEGAAKGGSWDLYRDAHLSLPSWFRSDLDPLSEAYRAQQIKLWQLIAGIDRDYDPELDECDMGWDDVDPVRQPGYYIRRDEAAVDVAADHWLATGMLLKHSKLRAGDRALEYGPGFGQTALALARLGVHVDTVDISERFCEYVRRQAAFFQVPLEAFRGTFNLNPRPSERYRLIWFYESFHHCLDFQHVVPRLAGMLVPGGRVILSGEPIVEEPCAAVPYPWGVRLHSEVAAVMRTTRWMELGFTEAFLFDLFERVGFTGHRVDCEPSPFGRLYVFELRSAGVTL